MSLDVLLPVRSDLGETLPARLSARAMTGSDSASASDGLERLGGAGYRVAPLLRLLGEPGGRTLVVGQLRVAVQADGTVDVEVGVQSRWTEQPSWRNQAVPAEGLSDAELAALEPALMSTSHPVPSREPSTVAAVVSKAAAEETRSAVGDLREIRYALESAMATSLQPGQSSSVPLMSALLELGVAANRARDVARAAVRQGLWLWLTDDEAYQGHRRAMDPTLVNRVAPADADTREWMSTHDAAVRQCQQVEAQLNEEAAQLRGLLDAAATVTSAKEAEAQETFTLLTGVAALGLGLPALVLSLYGADRLLPIKDLSRAIVLVPVALSAMLAAGLAVHRLPNGTLRSRIAMATLVVLVLIGLLALAGYVAPEAAEEILPGPGPTPS